MAKHSDEVFTPPDLFRRMRIRFDLDPCSPVGGGDYVPARRKFTIEDDGLAQPWRGRVWLNPPYSRPGPCVARLIAHGNGVALVPVSNGSKWFADLWASPAVIVYPPRKPIFIKDGRAHGIFSPVVIAGFGIICQRAVARLGSPRVLHGPTRTAEKAGR